MSEASTGLPPTARSPAELPGRRPERSDSAEERLFVASQWRLMWLKFRRHKVALVGVAVTVLFYLLAAFCEVVAPYDPRHRHGRHTFVPPQAVHFYDSEGGFSLRPFVYKLERHIDPRSLRRTYTEDQFATVTTSSCFITGRSTGGGGCSTPTSTCSGSTRRRRSSCWALTGWAGTCCRGSCTGRASRCRSA